MKPAIPARNALESGKSAVRWELYAHGSDIGIRGYGTDIDEAFAAIGVALTAVVCEPARVRPTTEVRVECAAPEIEALLYEWVNAIVYEMATRQMLFGRYLVAVANNVLTAKLWGEPVDPARHEPAVEIKGGTYTDLHVQHLESGYWSAQCVIDV